MKTPNAHTRSANKGPALLQGSIGPVCIYPHQSELQFHLPGELRKKTQHQQQRLFRRKEAETGCYTHAKEVETRLLFLYSGCHFHAVPWLWEPPQASPHMLCLNTRPPTPTLWTAFQSLFWALSLQPHFSFCACNMHTVPYMPDLTPTHPTLAEALQSFSLHLSTPQSCSDHSFPLHNSISIPCCDRIQHFLLGLN